MTFLWPGHLGSMLALPLLPLLYLWLLRRRRKTALRFSSLAIVRMAERRSRRRHVPAALIFVACALLLFASARPLARLTLPWTRSSILLAMDTSLSMRVSDVKPTRLAAAQAAARTFLDRLPRNVDVGLVTFAGGAQVAQRATLDRGALVSAIDSVQMQIGTAVGDAIVVCLAELFPEQGLAAGTLGSGSQRRARFRPETPSTGEAAGAKPVEPVAPGSYRSAAIILLSDGRRTAGIDTLEAAKLAADRGVRIDVIGLGTVDGAAATEGGMAIYMRLDEPTLREVARATGGEYYHAGTADDLRSVYEHLGSRLQVEARETELAPFLALGAAGLLLIAGGLSVLWFGRAG